MRTGCAARSIILRGALQLLDVLVAAAVEGLPLAAPPTAPVPGACYIVGASPTGAWAGRADQLAAFTSAGWRFVAPGDGLSAFIRSSGHVAVYSAGAWDIGTLRGSQVHVDGDQVLGPQGAAITGPAGGATVDAEARASIGQILTAMRGHGLIAM